MSKEILIIGSGLAGMSAALTIAEQGHRAILVSSLSAERAQSVMAEGGINGALDTKGEGDDPAQHAADTMKSAAGLASEKAIEGLTEAAPQIIRQLHTGGVQFNTDEKGNIDLRNFGGQRKKRTAFAKDDTGKQIVTALVDAVRRWEDTGMVQRHPHHEFVTLLFGSDRTCIGAVIQDRYTGEEMELMADGVIVASGGIHGLLADTTGSLNNTGAVTCELFRLGVPISNGEMIQYHPTTVRGNGKRMLITEAARGEGGRLFAWRDEKARDEKWYFMEERHPELGNLMPRDVTAREIWQVLTREKKTVYLDLTQLPEGVLEEKLSGLVTDCKKYIGLDPGREPIPVVPGIHYFMGGIMVDKEHRTCIPGLYAAGECAVQYHGANRLGGNSLLGAIYGGHVAGKRAVTGSVVGPALGGIIQDGQIQWETEKDMPPEQEPVELKKIQDCLQSSLGVIRDEKTMDKALNEMETYQGPMARLGEALLRSAIARKESRGGHYRKDYPERDDGEFQKVSKATFREGKVRVSFSDVNDISYGEDR